MPGHGGGADRLRAAGIEVVTGVRRAEAEALVADFYKHHLEGLPHVTLKAAVTLDGRMATRSGDSRWITGEAARRHAHRMRDRSDAIMVGIGTVLADDPALTVRHVRGQDPVRVVLDSALLPPDRSSCSMLLVRAGMDSRADDGGASRRPSRRRRAASRSARCDVCRSTCAAKAGRPRGWCGCVEGGHTLPARCSSGPGRTGGGVRGARLLNDAEASDLHRKPRPSMLEALTLDATVRRLGEDVLVEGAL